MLIQTIKGANAAGLDYSFTYRKQMLHLTNGHDLSEAERPPCL